MSKCDGENWRPLESLYGHYSASFSGLIRSNERHVPHGRGGLRRIEPRILRATKDALGYGRVKVQKDGKTLTRTVHQLVAEAFIGPRPLGHDICHNDNDPTNNRADNLRYATRSENLKDRLKHGTMNWGSRNGMAKLSEEDVIEIDRLLDEGLDKNALAAQFGVSFFQIRNIAQGIHWSQLTGRRKKYENYSIGPGGYDKVA